MVLFKRKKAEICKRELRTTHKAGRKLAYSSSKRAKGA